MEIGIRKRRSLKSKRGELLSNIQDYSRRAVDVTSGKGKALLDRCRDNVGEFLAPKEQFILLHTKDPLTNSGSAKLTGIVGVLVVIIIIGFSFMLLVTSNLLNVILVKKGIFT